MKYLIPFYGLHLLMRDTPYEPDSAHAIFFIVYHAIICGCITGGMIIFI